MKKILLLAAGLCLSSFIVKAQTMQQAPKGLQYQILAPGNGQKIKTDDIVTMNMIQKTEKDSVLFSSYKLGHPIQIKVAPAQNGADPMDVFPLLSVKDSALIRVPTDSVFKGHEQDRPAFLPANSNLIFIVKIEKVQSLNEAIAERNAEVAKMQQAESSEAEKYVAANKLAVKTTASGLKYVILSTTERGVGRKAQPGDTVEVNYVGRTLNGKVFDASVQAVAQEAGLQQPGREYGPIKVVLGQGQVIPGWDEGLLLLTEGQAAKLIIPSKLAYGSQGAGQDIPPFSTLVFDVNLIRVYPTKHAPAAAAKPAAKTAGKTSTAKKTTTTAKKAPVKKSH